MPLDPDTEIQYRKGGKIMKKTPRKFSAGGAAPAPSSDRIPPAEAAKLKAEKEQQKREAATQRKGAERPNLGQVFKKGGKVKKFSEGGDTVDWVPQTKYASFGDFFRGKKMEEKKPEPTPAPVNATTPPAESDADKAIKASKAADIPSFAEPSSYASQAAQDAPKGIKGGEHVVKAVTNEPAKPAAPKKVVPKAVTPKAAAPKEKESIFKGGFDQSAAEDARIKRMSRKTESKGATGGYDKKSEETDDTKLSLAERWAKRTPRRGSRAEDIYPSLAGKKAGGVIKKYAKGGGVESKGKTQGKIVKMAKGGSVRGYGVSKVTNKTKYV